MRGFKDMITVVAISDTHLKEFDIPFGEILIHCGDALLHGDMQELNKFAKWWNALPHPNKIYVPGNHCRIFEFKENEARAMLHNTHVLIDQTIEIGGLKIHGTPQTPEFCGWAFMHLDNREGLGKYFDLIPDGLDILVSHGPPKGFLDDAPSDPGAGVGSVELLKAIERAKPKYVLVGHIHCGRTQGIGGIDNYGSIQIINCSNVNERYKYAYPPRIIEFPDKK